jgi:hypothetical protein
MRTDDKTAQEILANPYPTEDELNELSDRQFDPKYIAEVNAFVEEFYARWKDLARRGLRAHILSEGIRKVGTLDLNNEE